MDEEAFALGGDVRQSVIDSGRTDVMTWVVAKYFFNMYLSKLRSRELGQDEEQAIILTLFPSNLFILSNLLKIEQLPKPYHIWRSSVQTHKTTGNIFLYSSHYILPLAPVDSWPAHILRCIQSNFKSPNTPNSFNTVQKSKVQNLF